MGKRDAFGREQGEDTLGAMGWRTPSTASEREQERPREERAAAVADAHVDGLPRTERPQAAPVRRPRRPHRVRNAVLILFALWFLVVPAVGVIALVVFSAAASPDRERATPVTGSLGSMHDTATLRHALERLPEGDLVALRVSRRLVHAQVDHEGVGRLVTVLANGTVLQTSEVPPLDLPPLHADAAAPARIIRTLVARGEATADRVASFELDADGWRVALDDGRGAYRADASGLDVRRDG